MARIPRMALVALVILLPASALAAGGAGAFGGFSTDGAAFLRGRTQVCKPITLDGAGTAERDHAACRTVTVKKDLQAYGFRKPAPAKGLVASVHGREVTVVGQGKMVALWHAPTDIDGVKAVYVSPGGDVLALEVVSVDAKKAKHLLAVAFDVSGRLAHKTPVHPQAQPKSAYERAMVAGGRWEQKIIPCDRAGVALRFKDSGRFALTVVVHCRADKETYDFRGAWETRGKTHLDLVFDQGSGHEGRMPCHFQSCENDASLDCLACNGGDIGFTAQSAARP